jgi:fused signal recognition particle receptor
VGQNAHPAGAASFGEAVRPTGIIVTKLDGSARGAPAVTALRRELGLPIRFLGVGEQLDDPSEPVRPASDSRSILLAESA